jgi:hypothetical protein
MRRIYVSGGARPPGWLFDTPRGQWQTILMNVVNHATGLCVLFNNAGKTQ